MRRKMKLVMSVIIITISIYLGFYLGDLILQYSTEIRTEDIVKCRVGLPFLGLILGIVMNLNLFDNE